MSDWFAVVMIASEWAALAAIVNPMGEFTLNDDCAYIARKQTSIIDERTTRHPGYVISQQKRKRIEEIFGWLKNRCWPALPGSAAKSDAAVFLLRRRAAEY